MRRGGDAAGECREIGVVLKVRCWCVGEQRDSLATPRGMELTGQWCLVVPGPTGAVWRRPGACLSRWRV